MQVFVRVVNGILFKTVLETARVRAKWILLFYLHSILLTVISTVKRRACMSDKSSSPGFLWSFLPKLILCSKHTDKIKIYSRKNLFDDSRSLRQHKLFMTLETSLSSGDKIKQIPGFSSAHFTFLFFEILKMYRTSVYFCRSAPWAETKLWLIRCDSSVKAKK